MNCAETIFLEARERLDPEDRQAYLDRACVGDKALRAQVEAMLSDAEAAETFFRPLESMAPGSNESPKFEQPGTVIGRYKLLEKIGEGGMGVVYMAEQCEPVVRKVALKIIKLGMDTKQVVARFEAERQALAMMDHPNIAKIYDGGIVGSPLPSSDEGRGQGEGSQALATRHSSLPTHYGRPYFVMELVRGMPITEFCRNNQLSAHERIQLFIPVCQAVQHAHQKGIIHRDLKPSNILVTLNDGVPHGMVIDFGVAKALSQRLTEKTLFTNFATMIGTPAYMSPEQAEMSKLDVDTRSDIYSLGVLLYELLTGTTPFPEKRLRSVAYAEMQRIILEEEPERPSTRLTKTPAASAFTRRDSKSKIQNPKSGIDPDLDCIVMKCLEKDRNRRYETANGLVADIQRFFDGEPIVARPPSAAYRFRKFIRRHKLQSASAAFAAAVLMLAVAVSSWQAVRATRAEREARDQAKLANEQAEIARSVKDFLTEQLLRSSGPFIDPLPDANKRPLIDRIARQLEGRFAAQPEIEAQLRFALGDAYDQIWESAKAAAQFERCLEIRRRVLTLRHSDTLETLARLAVSLVEMGRFSDAQRLTTEGLAVVRSPSLGTSRGAGFVLFEQGYLLFRARRHGESFPYLKEGFELLKKKLDPNDFYIPGISSVLAYATCFAGQCEEADRLVSEAIEQWGKTHAAADPMTALLGRTQADLLLQRGAWQKALPVLERTVPIHQQILGPDHMNTLEAEWFLGWAYEQKGDLAEAARIYSSLPDREFKYFPNDLARDHCHRIAQFFVRQRRFEEARAIYGPLRESYEKNPTELPWESEIFATATAATKGWPAVAQIWRNALDRSDDSLRFLQRKSWVFCYVGDDEAHRRLARRVLAAVTTASSFDDQRIAIELAGLGPIDLSDADIKKLDSLVASVRTLTPSVSKEERDWSYWAFGLMQLRLGRYDEAMVSLDKPIEASHEWDPGFRLAAKAICLHHLGRSEQARAALAESERIMKPTIETSLGPNEVFLDTGQLPYLTLRREARALFSNP